MKTYIIAEMAWGYTGDYKTAIEILKAASEAGANAIGIHITHMETYMTKDYLCTAGQTLSARDTGEVPENVYKYLDRINMTNDQWLSFDKEAEKLGIDIVAMCNDVNSFEFSKQMNIKKYVLAASLFHEWELIKKTIKYNNDIIIRIGGASLKEIDDIVNYILETDDKSKINLLAGIQLYPTPITELHINSVSKLIKRYETKTNVSLGLADHIDGDNPYAIYLPALALSLGVTTIEKHITTLRELKLEDFEAALGAEQFKQFVGFIRASEIALGDGSLDYLINPQNEKYRLVLRKRLVASRDINEGETIDKGSICFMRCDTGLELEHYDKVINRKASKMIKKLGGIDFSNVQV